MTPKFVVILDPQALKYDAFRYDEPGKVPPIVVPANPEEAKDAAPPEPEEPGKERAWIQTV